MSSTSSRAPSEEYVYIDLDDRAPWWTSMAGAIAAILIVGVLMAPWLIDLDGDQPESVASSTLQNSGSLCRPDASGVPAFLDPSVASWSRFCEWFIAPGMEPQDIP